jgi:hypothetical protein
MSEDRVIVPRKTGRPPGRPKTGGRQRGTKNKPKTSPAQDHGEVPPDDQLVSASTSRAAPTDINSLLAYQHAELAQIEQDLVAARANPLTLARDLSLFTTAKHRTLKSIAELTGATKITEAKIVASDAWRGMFAELAMILSKHPEALADLRKYLGTIAPQNPSGDASG